MRAAARRFPPGNRYGVIGYGIRRRRTGGVRAAAYGLTTYVVRKSRAPLVHVPSFSVKVGGRTIVVVPDVVGTGSAPRAAAGVSAPFSGLHAGAPMRANEDDPQLASVGCLLGNDQAATHLLTAGHVFSGGGDQAQPAFAALGADDDPIPIGQVQANLLDGTDLRRLGLTAPMDVALVALNGDGVAMAQASERRFVIDGVMRSSSADGEAAQVFSWLLGDFTPNARVTSLPTAVHFGSSVRGLYTVSGVLAADPCVTAEGDSGSALLAIEDGERLALGLCVGAFRTDSVFEPLDRALKALRSTFGPFNVWNNPV